jgi:hypothetical protein
VSSEEPRIWSPPPSRCGVAVIVALRTISRRSSQWVSPETRQLKFREPGAQRYSGAKPSHEHPHPTERVVL